MSGSPLVLVRFALVAVALAVAFVFLWLGLALLIDAYGRRGRRESLAGRLARHQAVEVAADAEAWLRHR